MKKASDQIAVRGEDTGRDVSAGHLFVSLSRVHRIDREEVVSKEDDSLNEAQLVKESTVKIEPGRRYMLRMEGGLEIWSRQPTMACS